MPKPPVTGIEVGDDQPDIQTVAENKDFASIVSNETFMNEIVTVLVHESTDPNQPPHIILNVNGTNMPVIRGTPTRMKRKYLEVLARMKETRYEQRTPNPSEPERIVMVPKTAQVYPFSVLEDKSMRGSAWLANVMAERG